MVHSSFQRTHSLQKAFLSRSAHTHHFTGSLHLGAQTVAGFGEFIKGESGHFGHDVVQCRLEGSGRIGKGNFIQAHSHTDFSRNPCNGIAAGLGSQGGGTGNTGVYFDKIILERAGVQSKLYIASAFNLQSPDNFQSAVSEHLIFVVCQSLGRAHHNRVTGMNTYRV